MWNSILKQIYNVVISYQGLYNKPELKRSEAHMRIRSYNLYLGLLFRSIFFH